MTTRVVWYTPGDERSIFLTVHMYCPVSLLFTRWISRAPSLVMLTLFCPTLVIPLLFIPAIQSHAVSLWSQLFDAQTFQNIMSNVSSFFITSCNAGQGKVTFNSVATKEKIVWEWCFGEGLTVGTLEWTSPCNKSLGQVPACELAIFASGFPPWWVRPHRVRPNIDLTSDQLLKIFIFLLPRKKSQDCVHDKTKPHKTCSFLVI